MSYSVLVLAGTYPDNEGHVGLMYVHTRNIYYVKNGLDVTVLNFESKSIYRIDGVNVTCYKDYKNQNKKYDLLILHAANIREHLRFLLRYKSRFPAYLFFYHGHEIMHVNKEYSEPYFYVKSSKTKYLIQNVYDQFKLMVWNRFLRINIEKCKFIFVSNWMYNVFLRNLKLPNDSLNGKVNVIYNGVAEEFENRIFDSSSEKKYDFVTIRSNLDASKYGIDIVNRIAKNTPNAKFLIVGKGKFFDYYDRANNVEWQNRTLNHEEIIKILNQSKYALMPTRTDAQGLMTCEMAAFGMPVITSDIEVCHEIFDGFCNVTLIDNKDDSLSLESFVNKPIQAVKDERLYMHKTVQKEIDLIYKIINEVEK